MLFRSADSPVFPAPPLDMMADMSRVADDYGLDVWIWYPAMDEDYAKPETVEFALKEWEEVYKRLPRINDGVDAVPRRILPRHQARPRWGAVGCTGICL